MNLNLRTMADIAPQLPGVSYNTLRQWRKRGLMPAEADKPGGVPVWEAETIDPWIRQVQAAMENTTGGGLYDRLRAVLHPVDDRGEGDD